ncbi:MAG TPA: sulfite dehydrogenase [Oceanospirillales bacterium]|nr:sulfite dehydrogenase [Oceanospirillales bacterium]
MKDLKSTKDIDSLDNVKTDESVTDNKNSRRKFLSQAAAATAVVATGSAAANNLPPNVPEWQKHLGKPVNSNPYGMPSKYESGVKRLRVPWLTPDSIASISFTPLAEIKGMISPNGLAFERDHGGLPTIDPAQHRLMIHGLVEKPIILTMDDIKRFPNVSRIHFIECPANSAMEWKGPQVGRLQFTHGMTNCCEWTGVPLKYILAEVGVKPEGKWLLAEGADSASMSRSIPMEKALDDTLVVFGQNGEALRPEQGYPLRLLTPGWEGNTSIKWLRRLEVLKDPAYQREETSKYTDLLNPNDPKRKDLIGKAYLFSWIMEAKAIITFPCPEKPLKDHGKYVINGLAWTGTGKIKHVDVSFDGGINWKQAELNGLVLDKCWTRFSIPFEWNGEEVLLQSRATGEDGYVQPTLKQLREARGVSSIYHNNAIHTWKINKNGEVESVQV